MFWMPRGEQHLKEKQPFQFNTCKTRVLVPFRPATKSCLDKWTHLLARTNAVSFMLYHQASVKPSEPAEFTSSCQLLICGWQCRMMASFSWLQALFAPPLSSHTLQPASVDHSEVWLLLPTFQRDQHPPTTITSWSTMTNWLLRENVYQKNPTKNPIGQCMLVSEKTSCSGCCKISVNYIMSY